MKYHFFCVMSLLFPIFMHSMDGQYLPQRGAKRSATSQELTLMDCAYFKGTRKSRNDFLSRLSHLPGYDHDVLVIGGLDYHFIDVNVIDGLGPTDAWDYIMTHDRDDGYSKIMKRYFNAITLHTYYSMTGFGEQERRDALQKSIQEIQKDKEQMGFILTGKQCTLTQRQMSIHVRKLAVHVNTDVAYRERLREQKRSKNECE